MFFFFYMLVPVGGGLRKCACVVFEVLGSREILGDRPFVGLHFFLFCRWRSSELMSFFRWGYFVLCVTKMLTPRPYPPPKPMRFCSSNVGKNMVGGGGGVVGSNHRRSDVNLCEQLAARPLSTLAAVAVAEATSSQHTRWLRISPLCAIAACRVREERVALLWKELGSAYWEERTAAPTCGSLCDYIFIRKMECGVFCSLMCPCFLIHTAVIGLMINRGILLIDVVLCLFLLPSAQCPQTTKSCTWSMWIKQSVWQELGLVGYVLYSERAQKEAVLCSCVLFFVL